MDDHDFTRECAVAADWVVSVVAPPGCPERNERAYIHHIENLRFGLIGYFRGCLRSGAKLGSDNDRWGSELLSMVAPRRWKRRIKEHVAYVVIRPGEVGVKPQYGPSQTIKVATPIAS